MITGHLGPRTHLTPNHPTHATTTTPTTAAPAAAAAAPHLQGHAQSCAKATLVGLPDNPYRLTQLWTLMLVAIAEGKTAGTCDV